MIASQRQRLIEALWPKFEKALRETTADRSLRTALAVGETSSPGTGHVHTHRGGKVDGFKSGDDVILLRTADITTEDLVVSAAEPEARALKTCAKLIDKFFKMERSALSEIVVYSTEPIESKTRNFPDELVGSIRSARTSLHTEGALDLLLTADNATLLADSAHQAGVEHVLRGGSILTVVGGADGLVLPHLPGPVTLAEQAAPRLDWDITTDGIRLIVSQRLRYWRAHPKCRAVNLTIETTPTS